MRSTEISTQRPRPIAAGGGRLAAFLAGSAALGSMIIALLVVLADLDDEPEDGQAWTRTRTKYRLGRPPPDGRAGADDSAF